MTPDSTKETMNPKIEEKIKRHRLGNGVITRYGAYKPCLDCFERIYSEIEWEQSSCPGPILNPGALENMRKQYLEDLKGKKTE